MACAQASLAAGGCTTTHRASHGSYSDSTLPYSDSSFPCSVRDSPKSGFWLTGTQSQSTSQLLQRRKSTVSPGLHTSFCCSPNARAPINSWAHNLASRRCTVSCQAGSGAAPGAGVAAVPVPAALGAAAASLVGWLNQATEWTVGVTAGSTAESAHEQLTSSTSFSVPQNLNHLRTLVEKFFWALAARVAVLACLTAPLWAPPAQWKQGQGPSAASRVAALVQTQPAHALTAEVRLQSFGSNR